MAARAWAARLQSLESLQWQPPVGFDRRFQERALLMRAAVRFATFDSLLRRFARDRHGVSAIEFAIVLPFMLFLYIGGVEIGQGYQIQFKVTETARTVTDLASQYISLNSSTMSSILNASSTVVSPYSSSNMTVTVS